MSASIGTNLRVPIKRSLTVAYHRRDFLSLRILEKPLVALRLIGNSWILLPLQGRMQEPKMWEEISLDTVFILHSMILRSLIKRTEGLISKLWEVNSGRYKNGVPKKDRKESCLRNLILSLQWLVLPFSWLLRQLKWDRLNHMILLMP